jgi:hypothetical protein
MAALVPRESDYAKHGSLAQQRHPEVGSHPGRHRLGHRVVRVGEDVRDVHDPAFERHPPGNAVATGDKCSLPQGRPMLGLRCTERTRHIAVDLALAHCDRCGICAAKPGGYFRN